MNAQTQKLQLRGAAGLIEALRDAGTEAAPSVGTAVIAHPHPLYGGTMDNKVVQTLARAFVACGWSALRFNFRGVGTSEGAHDEGFGETDDLLAVIEQMAPQGPLAIAGFSFGAYVACRAIERLYPLREIRQVVLAGTAASRFAIPALPAQVRARALVVHGEQDDTVPLASVFDWARPQSLPVTVIPGGEHFFHGQLQLLKTLAIRHLEIP